ncbi:hypothetical protein M0Q50_08975 [bacterium]|jgi:hypothetical protein|nr:hypothetical protein [bacterium]
MSLKSSIESYKEAEYLHNIIDDSFNELNNKGLSDAKKESLINKTLIDLNKFNNLLNKINIRDLEGNYSQETVDDVEHNINFFYEASEYIENFITGLKYYDSLLNGVNSYFDKLKFSEEINYKLYAKDDYDLVLKFTEMLIHPNNIRQFMNQIKRIALGTMSVNEFKKIFKTNKHRMNKIGTKVYDPKVYEFVSYNEYKNYI